MWHRAVSNHYSAFSFRILASVPVILSLVSLQKKHDEATPASRKLRQWFLAGRLDVDTYYFRFSSKWRDKHGDPLAIISHILLFLGVFFPIRCLPPPIGKEGRNFISEANREDVRDLGAIQLHFSASLISHLLLPSMFVVCESEVCVDLQYPSEWCSPRVI